MSQVGNFPGMVDLRRRTVRAPSNPLDKSTIVSIFPKAFDQINPTIQPGRFHVEAGSYDNPALLVVGPSSWWKELDEEQPLLEIPTSSISIADSIVRDHCNGLIACNMSDLMPGIFFVPGDFTRDYIKKNFKNLLDIAATKQKNWFTALVKMADVLWSRTNGNPLSISDDMRLAARELNLNQKEWLKDFQVTELIRCIGCGSLKNPQYPICPTCKSIDMTHPNAKDIKIAS